MSPTTLLPTRPAMRPDTKMVAVHNMYIVSEDTKGNRT